MEFHWYDEVSGDGFIIAFLVKYDFKKSPEKAHYQQWRKSILNLLISSFFLMISFIKID